MLDNSRDGTKHLTGLDFGPDGGSKSGSCCAINPDKTKVTKVMKWQETDRVEIVELPIEGCPDNSSQDNSSRTIRRKIQYFCYWGSLMFHESPSWSDENMLLKWKRE